VPGGRDGSDGGCGAGRGWRGLGIGAPVGSLRSDQARTASPPRASIARIGEGRGAPGRARKLLWKYRFDQDQRSARSLSGSVRRVALLRPYRFEAPGGRARPTKPRPGSRAYPPHACRSRQPFGHTVSVIHARQGSRPKIAVRLESEPPPTSAPARPHPQAAKVAGHAPSPSPRGGIRIRAIWKVRTRSGREISRRWNRWGLLSMRRALTTSWPNRPRRPASPSDRSEGSCRPRPGRRG
jgi:hypothetical protein